MTPQPNEPTAEAIEAALSHLSNYFVLRGDPEVILQYVRALRAENDRLKAENYKAALQLGGLQSCIAEELDLPKTPLDDDDVRPLIRQLRASLSTAVDALDAIVKACAFERGVVFSFYRVDANLVENARKTLAQLRPLLAGRHCEDCDPSFTCWNDRAACRKQPPAAEVKADLTVAIKTAWKAGVTCAANVAIERSNRINSEDGDLGIVHALSDVGIQIAKWSECTDYTLDEIRQMLPAQAGKGGEKS